jgi:hypothetical protein
MGHNKTIYWEVPKNIYQRLGHWVSRLEKQKTKNQLRAMLKLYFKVSTNELDHMNWFQLLKYAVNEICQTKLVLVVKRLEMNYRV